MSFRPKKNSGMDALLGAKLSETYKDVLTLPLEHGDIMVMHGTLIHRFYEVSLFYFTCTELTMNVGLKTDNCNSTWLSHTEDAGSH